MKSYVIYLDGEMIKAEEKYLELLSPGVVKGKGVFETIRIYSGLPFALDLHLERMSRGLKIFSIKKMIKKIEAEKIIYQLLKYNKLKNARVRIVIWKNRNIERISGVCLPIKPRAKSYKVLLSNVRRNKTKASYVKSIKYKIFRDAYLSAKGKKFDEAILLNDKKEIVEGSRSNIFFIKNKVVYTPKIESGCLSGITRKVILENLNKIGIKYKVGSFTERDLLKADEAFLTNSIIESMPITKVNNHKIGLGKIGNVTIKIMKLYKDIVNNNTG